MPPLGSPLPLTLVAEAFHVPTFSPWLVSALSIGVGVVAFLAAAALYVRQINKSHARLMATVETELAERRKAEGFYHSLVESLPQSILRKDLEGRFTFGNQKFCAALDRRGDQIVGTTDFDYFPRELAEKYRRDDREVMDTGQIFETVEEHVTPHHDKLYVHVIKTPLYAPHGQIIGVQGIFWDVTERKRDEEKLKRQNILLEEMARSEHQARVKLMEAQSHLVQTERLASLGQLVAGVAHEINNPVSFVNNNVAVLGRDVGEIHEMLLMYREADDLIAREAPDLCRRIRELRDRVDMDYTVENIHGLLDRSRDGLKRIHQIVGNLRAFAHLDEGEVNVADLNAEIQSTVSIIHGHARKKHVKLESDLHPLPAVTCNAAKINQVVMNLLSNAIDACDEGGEVKILTRPEEQGVRIEVVDDGCGIDEAIRDRIFDPFVTTKPVGQGTGLGLSISYGIIQDHGGTIDVESAPGEGTRFLVHLPLRAAAKAKKRTAEPPKDGALGAIAATQPEPVR